jgi:hypothetical protein
MTRIAVFALAACGSAPPVVANRSTPTPVTPAPFAGLFRAGARWTFAAEMTIDAATTRGTVTCRIDSVLPIPHGSVSSLRCDGMQYANRIDHRFVATTAGMWIVGDEFDGDAATLAPSAMVMSSPPRENMQSTMDDPSYPTGHLLVVAPHGEGWCMTASGFGGDETGWELCVSAARGVVGGRGFVAGWFETRFGDIPRH